MTDTQLVVPSTCARCDLLILGTDVFVGWCTPDGVDRVVHAACLRPGDVPMGGTLDLIGAERERQRGKWSLAHDDGHIHGEMALAAACYAANEPLFVHNSLCGYDTAWPWEDGEGCNRDAAHDDRIRSLVIAGALIVAEIERITRLQSTEQSTSARSQHAAPNESDVTATDAGGVR